MDWRLGIALLFVAAPVMTAQTPEVAPILEKCVTCHGGSQQMGALDLRTAASLRKGGKSGPAIIPGNAEQSHLYRRIMGREEPAMPFGDKLSAGEIDVIKKWIDAGAPWQESARANTG